jgi:hypothetical protein
MHGMPKMPEPFIQNLLPSKGSPTRPLGAAVNESIPLSRRATGVAWTAYPAIRVGSGRVGDHLAASMPNNFRRVFVIGVLSVTLAMPARAESIATAGKQLIAGIVVVCAAIAVGRSNDVGGQTPIGGRQQARL